MTEPTPRSGLPELPCACATLRRATRAVTQIYDEALRPAGLRATQFTLLQVLDRTGEIGQGRLGQILAMDGTTLSRTLRPLEGEGWIAVAPGADRRERRIALTRTGRRKMERAIPLWHATQERFKAALGKADWAGLFAALERAAAAAQAA